MAKGTKAAGKAMGMAKKAIGAVKGERGIFLKLREEHGLVSAMMRRIAATNDPDTRRTLFYEMKRDLIGHAKGEEAELYPVLKSFEELNDLMKDSFEDHQAVEVLLDKLSEMDFGSDAWMTQFEELMSDVTDHVEFEENEVFPVAMRLIGDEQAKEIEDRFVQTKMRVVQKVA